MSLHQMYWFQLDVSQLDQFLFMYPSVSGKIIKQLQSLPARVIKMKAGTEESLHEVFSDIASGTELGRIKASTMLGVLLCQIIENADTPTFRLTPDIGRTMDYILEHIQEELPMEDLGKYALLSVSRFKQKFKSEVGISPRSFINFHKIEAAKKMLQDGHSVTDTAMELAFSSSNYFSAVFRRYTSLSPTEYIEQIQNHPADSKQKPSSTDLSPEDS